MRFSRCSLSTPAEVRSAASPAARGAFVRLLRSSAVYAVANFGIKSLSFLLLPLYTRFLAPADYGVISLAETLAALIAIVGGLGLGSALGRLRHAAGQGAGFRSGSGTRDCAALALAVGRLPFRLCA